jgi:hypothetical protein
MIMQQTLIAGVAQCADATIDQPAQNIAINN